MQNVWTAQIYTLRMWNDPHMMLIDSMKLLKVSGGGGAEWWNCRELFKWKLLDSHQSQRSLTPFPILESDFDLAINQSQVSNASISHFEFCKIMKFCEADILAQLTQSWQDIHPSIHSSYCQLCHAVAFVIKTGYLDIAPPTSDWLTDWLTDWVTDWLTEQELSRC